MKDILLELLDTLEKIGSTHGEIYDTEVREQMFDAVYQGFIAPQPNYLLPERFGLYDAEANQLVRAALTKYIAGANEAAEAKGLVSPSARLAEFQKAGVYTTNEGQSGDEFFGWLAPADLP